MDEFGLSTLLSQFKIKDFLSFPKKTVVCQEKKKNKNNNSLSEQNYQQIQEVMMFNEYHKPSLYPHGHTFTTSKLGT